jgi:hypothetical protein
MPHLYQWLPAITGMVREIQPHQYLTDVCDRPSAPSAGAESVDAASPALYKGANGGGRNPAAAVL